MSYKASWRHLFAFTRWTHTGPLVLALVATAFIAAFKTVLAVILGKIFDILADFGNGTRDSYSALHGVTNWCIVLVGIGMGNWLANSAFIALWVAFGELQADSARGKVFESLIAKDMAWFDCLDQGVSSLLVQTQT